MNHRAKLPALALALAPLHSTLAADAPTSLSQGQIPDALRAAFVQVKVMTQDSGGETAPSTLPADLHAERPTITAGYLVAPDLVIAPDFNIPSRFVRGWLVSNGTNFDTGENNAGMSGPFTIPAPSIPDTALANSGTIFNEDPVKIFHENPGKNLITASGTTLTTTLTTTPNADSGNIPRSIIAAGLAARLAVSHPTHPIAYAADRNAMLLKLPGSFPGARPLEFTPAADTPLTSCFTIKYTAGIYRRATIEPLAWPRWQISPDGARAHSVSPNSIIATDAGAPLALALTDTLQPDDTWKTPWRDWPWIYEDDLNARLKKLAAATDAALIHADLKLRPQPVRAGDNPLLTTMRATADPSAQPQPAIVLTPRRVLILATLDPATTARLETITLRLPNNEHVPARFIATIAAHGALVVEPEHPIPAPLTLPAAPADWPALLNHLLLTIDLRLQGETRLARPGATRILSLAYGLHDTPDPDFITPRPADPSPTLFLFDLDGNLLGIPLRPRAAAAPGATTLATLGAPPGAADPAAALSAISNVITTTILGRATTTTHPQIIDASALAQYTRAPGKWADPSNIPLTETEERALVWLGVDLQPLTRELAQAQGVAEQTQNGATGALVTKVHPRSPAARAGLRTGDVLLRMRRANDTQAIPVRAPATNALFAQMFTNPNQQIPESMYDRIPPPWPAADNPLNQTLKQIGAGKPMELDYARDGAFATVKFTPAKGPAYYGTAPESIIPTLGLNVKSLTFETRAYYKIPDDQTALIISRVVAGSPAAIAGLRPYDLITEVNDQPVTTPAAFADLAKPGAKQLRLLTRRLSQTRIVTLEP